VKYYIAEFYAKLGQW